MTHYCLGFVTDPTGQNVLLIEKRRPSWQAGRLNGIGGKLEGDEDGLAAMRRECSEETGLAIDDWSQFDEFRFEGGSVQVFWATADLTKAQATTDEPLRVVSLQDAIDGRFPLVDEVQDLLHAVQHLVAEAAPAKPGGV